MCTSYVVRGERTWIGMNFDISERPIKLACQKDSRLIVWQEEGGQFFPALGINKSGTFMNLHMVEANEAGRYRRGKDCVHIMKLFDQVLGEKLALEDVPGFADNHSIVNVPGHSVHSLIAGEGRRACIVEPGKKTLDFALEDGQFVVQTNFSLCAVRENGGIAADSTGADRYRTVFERLAAIQGKVDVETAFSLLQEAAQRTGGYPTQLSLVALPDEAAVYFALKARFERVYRFSFDDRQIRTERGFLHSRQGSLAGKGLLISELDSW